MPELVYKRTFKSCKTLTKIGLLATETTINTHIYRKIERNRYIERERGRKRERERDLGLNKREKDYLTD